MATKTDFTQEMRPTLKHAIVGRTAGSAIVALVALACLGCEPATFPMAIESAAQQVALVDPSPAKKLDWPVTNESWQVARPTGFSFLRGMRSGRLGELAAVQRQQAQARIAASERAGGPAPWSVEKQSRDPAWNSTIKALLGESDGMPQADMEFMLPAGCAPAEVKLDLFTKRIALIDDRIWAAHVPWPQLANDEAADSEEAVDAEGTGESEERLQESEPEQLSPLDDQQFAILPASTWRAINLPAQSGEQPIRAEFFGDAGQMIATQGRSVFLIDTDQQKIVASVKAPSSILHLSVAARVGDAIVVDDQGMIHFVAAGLSDIYEIGKCDLELPMPVISAESGRIASYHTAELGRVYKINDSRVTSRLDISIASTGSPQLICSSPAYDYWIDETRVTRRPNYPYEEGADLKGWPFSVYWKVQQAIPIGVSTQTPWLFCIAERPLPGGKTELVAFDCEFGAREFYKPLPWSRYQDAVWAISGDGWQIAIVEDGRVEVASRMIKHPQNLSSLQSRAQHCTWNQQYDVLEDMAKIVRELPEGRMNRTPEEMYIEIVKGVCEMWRRTKEQAHNESETQERRDLAEASIDGARNWLAKRSTLALCCELRAVRETTKRVEQTWKELARRDDIPLAAYMARISCAATNGDHDILTSTLQECISKYPLESAPHQLLVTRFLERSGGTRGSASAYASAIGNAMGSPHGDFVYAQLINEISVYFTYTFFDYAFVDGRRVLAGIREGMRSGDWQANDTLGCMMVLGTSHSRPDAAQVNSPYAMAAKQLTSELAEYYRQRYPMLVNDYRSNWIKSFVVQHLPY